MLKRQIILSLFGLTALLALTLPGCTKQDVDVRTPISAAGTGTRFFPNDSSAITQGTPAGTGFPGVIILSINEAGYSHLFAYSPLSYPLTRLTFGKWSDITPSLSPDGQKLAFASNRSGYWDLYLLDLSSGETNRLTNTKEYDAAPTWSPDGFWLAFETYIDDNLEIAILSVATPGDPAVRLTYDPAADHSPAWSPPPGRQIVFISTRSKDSDVWLADLDRTGEERFRNISHNPRAIEGHPSWAPDGNHLVWASDSFSIEMSGIYIWDAEHPGHPPIWLGNGDWPAMDEKGEQIVSVISLPNQTYLSAYTLRGDLLLQPVLLPGEVRGLLWMSSSLSDPLPESFKQSSEQTPAPLWTSLVKHMTKGPTSRRGIVPLEDVQAPYPRLHDMVDESFNALRQRVIEEAGWDALANLENAFTPLTTPLDPGSSEDWLYTGRAFALNTILTNAGWLTAVRQDLSLQTYWRIYLIAQAQDGSMGEPIHDPPWDLAGRYNLDPHTYEEGGQFAFVPSGYWIDFTSLANKYGWERIPALSNWRTFYNGTRFTEFVQTSGLDWYSAMLEIYPPEALITSTAVIPQTHTPTTTLVPTWTPWFRITPKPSLTPTPPFTPTFIPVNTPLP